MIWRAGVSSDTGCGCVAVQLCRMATTSGPPPRFIFAAEREEFSERNASGGLPCGPQSVGKGQHAYCQSALKVLYRDWPAAMVISLCFRAGRNEKPEEKSCAKAFPTSPLPHEPKAKQNAGQCKATL